MLSQVWESEGDQKSLKWPAPFLVEFPRLQVDYPGYFKGKKNALELWAVWTKKHAVIVNSARQLL